MILPRKKNNFLEKHITFYPVLWIRASNLRRLVKTSCTVVKTAFYMYKQFQKNWCLAKSLLFLSLLKFNQNLFGVLAKKYGTVVKTTLHVYRWSCRERRTNLLNNTKFFYLFWEFERQIYGVWWGSFMHGCQNCILHVRRNNSRKNWSWRKKFTVFITFEI